MQHKIIGTTMPVLEMTLDPGDCVIAEAGELSWLTSTIELRTSTSAGANKGFFGAIKRAVGGGSLFMTEYSAAGRPPPERQLAIRHAVGLAAVQVDPKDGRLSGREHLFEAGGAVERRATGEQRLVQG